MIIIEIREVTSEIKKQNMEKYWITYCYTNPSSLKKKKERREILTTRIRITLLAYLTQSSTDVEPVKALRRNKRIVVIHQTDWNCERNMKEWETHHRWFHRSATVLWLASYSKRPNQTERERYCFDWISILSIQHNSIVSFYINSLIYFLLLTCLGSSFFLFTNFNA